MLQTMIDNPPEKTGRALDDGLEVVATMDGVDDQLLQWLIAAWERSA